MLKKIIGKHFVIGILERFDESLLLFAENLGWTKPIYYLKKNVTKHRRSYPELLVEHIM